MNREKVQCARCKKWVDDVESTSEFKLYCAECLEIEMDKIIVSIRELRRRERIRRGSSNESNSGKNLFELMIKGDTDKEYACDCIKPTLKRIVKQQPALKGSELYISHINYLTGRTLSQVDGAVNGHMSFLEHRYCPFCGKKYGTFLEREGENAG
ncbi:MAG TPA: hypothetical protein PLW45_05890 [Anaerolineaceae bacterium]|nr:hypothetical protein [Anaerolineaceae bacterium]